MKGIWHTSWITLVWIFPLSAAIDGVDGQERATETLYAAWQ
jgi:hypothetical protein